MVPMTGFEPVRIPSADFKSAVSAIPPHRRKNKERMCKLRTCVSTSYVAYYHYTIESTSFKRNQPTGELPILSIIGHVNWTKKREGVLLHAPFQDKRKSFRSNNQIFVLHNDNQQNSGKTTSNCQNGIRVDLAIVFYI